MQSIIIQSLDACSHDIRQRIDNINQRLMQKRPGFRSIGRTEGSLLDQQHFLLERSFMSEQMLPLTDRPAGERERLPSQINTSRSSDRMDELLVEAALKSQHIRGGIQTIAGKLGLHDDAASQRLSYVVKLKHPFGQNDSLNDSVLKPPSSNKGRRHNRSLTEGASDMQHTPRSNAQHPKGWKWQATSDISAFDMRIEQEPEKNEVSKATSMVMPEKQDEQEQESKCEENFLSKAQITNIQIQQQQNITATEQSLELSRGISKISRRELDILTTNQYLLEYLATTQTRLQQNRLPPKINARIYEKFASKLQKRIEQTIHQASNQVEQPKKRSQKDLSNSFDVQQSIRQKLIRKVLEMRDPAKYK